MLILGIETSCDETAASVIDANMNEIKVLSNIVDSQIEIHKKYKGVIPEVAAREHVLKILPVIDKALHKAAINRQTAPEKLSAIAVTNGPGLVSSLMAGVETAKTLSFIWDIPLVAVHHIEAHIYANFIGKQNQIKFPAIILTVSGGHTMIIKMNNHSDIEIIGETRDDAAGEAFDKAAKLMDLEYPGGPVVSSLSRKAQENKDIVLPRPMLNSGDFDFSFSGLKTALRYALEKDRKWQDKIPEYCFEFQEAVVDVLVNKTIKAGKKFHAQTIMLAGGVSANNRLREKMAIQIDKEISQVKYVIPELKYTTDNAAMVASTAYFKAQNKKFISWQEIKVDPNLKLIPG